MTTPAAVALRALALWAAFCAVPALADPPRCVKHRDAGLHCPQGSRPCLADGLGKVFCAPPDGGVEVNNFGQPLCGPGYCTRDWKGDVFCAKTPRGASAADMYGKPLCVGGCVPGQAELCVKPTAQ